MKILFPKKIGAISIALALTSCETPTQTGALLGAATGAALGAAIDDGDRGRGALIGGAIGTAAGAVGGSIVEARAERYHPAPQDHYEGFPYATTTGRPGQVRSPHKPYNVIDVTGFRRGEVVTDPTTGRHFRIP